MKRGIAIVIVLTLVFSLATACGGGGNSTTEPTPEPEPEDPTANFGEFRWPRSELASLIPVPKSTFGEIGWEQSYGFVIYVGETSKSDYVEYVDECWDRGFTFEYRRGDDFFWADNVDGHKVTVRYDDEFSIMFIRMDAADEDESKPTPTPEPQDSGDNQGSDDNAGNTGTPTVPDYDWRQFLKDYEEWMDDYIAFLKKYEEDPNNLDLLMESLDLMIKAAEWAERAEEIEADLENDPVALKEYIEVLTRILKKLTDAM